MALNGIKNDLIQFSSLQEEFRRVFDEEMEGGSVNTDERATQIYQKTKKPVLLSSNEDRAHAYAELASQNIKEKKYDKVIELAKNGLKLNPTSEPLINNLMGSLFNAFMQKEDYAASIDYAEALFLKYHQSSTLKIRIIQVLVHAYLAIKNYEKALSYAKKGIDLAPQDSNITAALYEASAYIHIRNERFHSAFEAARLGIKAPATKINTHIDLQKYLFCSYIFQNDPEVLFEKIERLLRTKTSIKGLTLENVICNSSRIENGSLKKKMTEKNPIDPSFFTTLCSKLSFIYSLEEKYDLAMQVAQLGLEEKNADRDSKALIHEKLSYFYAFQKNLPESEKEMDKALELCTSPLLKAHFRNVKTKISDLDYIMDFTSLIDPSVNI